MNHPTPQDEQDAYDRAHAKHSRNPEEQAKFINENLRLMQPEDLRELVTAINAVRAGDQGAIKRLTQQKQQELQELRKQYAQQLEGKQ